MDARITPLSALWQLPMASQTSPPSSPIVSEMFLQQSLHARSDLLLQKVLYSPANQSVAKIFKKTSGDRPVRPFPPKWFARAAESGKTPKRVTQGPFRVRCCERTCRNGLFSLLVKASISSDL